MSNILRNSVSSGSPSSQYKVLQYSKTAVLNIPSNMPFDAQAFMVLTSLHRCSTHYISITCNANGIIHMRQFNLHFVYHYI